MPKNQIMNREYWENNIKGFSGFYDTQSEENIQAAQWVSYLYKKFIFPIEKKFMFKRHQYVSNYIEKNVKNGMKVADIGCGTGIYTKKMIRQGAYVYALDYTQSAISLTKSNLTAEEMKGVELLHFDVTQSHIPCVDLSISIGVLPYIEDLNVYLDNILPFTNMFLFNYLSSANYINRIRKIISILEVRNYSYHHPHQIKIELEKKKYSILKQTQLATGFILETKKI